LAGFERIVRLSLGVVLVSTALLLLNPGGSSSVAGALDEPSLIGKYLLLAVAWAAYGAVHSVMISEAATGFLKRRLGGAFRFYRLFFNVTATVLLLPLVSYSMSLRRGPLVRWEGPWLAIRFTLVAVGVLLFVTGGRHYSLSQFIGISQLRGTLSEGLAAGVGSTRGVSWA
jgi:hypothetical protein